MGAAAVRRVRVALGVADSRSRVGAALGEWPADADADGVVEERGTGLATSAVGRGDADGAADSA